MSIPVECSTLMKQCLISKKSKQLLGLKGVHQPDTNAQMANGVSALLLLSGAGTVTRAHVNLGQSNYMWVKHHLETFITHFDFELGNDAGFLFVVDNFTNHHKTLPTITEQRGYYLPSTP